MLLALHILLDTLAPAENAPGVRVFMNAITGDPVLCIVIGAVVTWAVHSSVATVLLIMSLAYAHFVTPYAALALVLGANLGSAINPVFEGARRDNPASYRLPVGNLLNRLVGVLLVAPLLRPIAEALQAWQPDLAKATAEFHIAFNVATAIDLHRPARPHGEDAEEAAAQSRAGSRSRRGRAISTRARWKRRRSRWRTPRAKPCTWAISSR